MYRIGRIRQAVEFLLHLLQDFCGGAVLRFAMVDLVQDSIENLPGKIKNKKTFPTKSVTYKHIKRKPMQWVALQW